MAHAPAAVIAGVLSPPAGLLAAEPAPGGSPADHVAGRIMQASAALEMPAMPPWKSPLVAMLAALVLAACASTGLRDAERADPVCPAQAVADLGRRSRRTNAGPGTGLNSIPPAASHRADGRLTGGAARMSSRAKVTCWARVL